MDSLFPSDIEDRIVAESYEPDDTDLPMTYGSRIIPSKERSSLPAMQTAVDGVSVSLAGSSETLQKVLIDNHLFDPQVLEERTPFYWPSEISSSRLDSYDTRMDPETSLKNYAVDAADGVSFCDSHNHTEQAFGRSFAGLMVNETSVATAPMGEDPPNPPTVYAAWYTFPGLQLNRVNTDHLIFGIRSGIVKDISIGFKPGPGFMYRCSLCGENMWSWDCPHIPGATEKVVVNEATGQTEERYIFSWVVGARLSEGSGVYDGATPRAMILKAMREARVGRIPSTVLRMVESMTRIQLPRKRALLPVQTRKDDKESLMDNEKDKETQQRAAEDQKSLKGIMGQIRTILSKADIDVDEDATPDAAFRSFRQYVDELKEKADRGDRMFKVLVEQALEEGARAQGDKFDKDKWERRLNNMDPADVEDMRSGWKETADTALGGGGRRSKDGGSDSESGGGDDSKSGEEGTRSSETSEELTLDEMYSGV